jgi:hypothetical protein
MKLAAIHTGKVSVLIEIADLVPNGKIFAPELINAIAARCEFRKTPKEPDKLQQEGGLVFELGKWEDQPINKLSLFGDGIVLETSSSTEDTDATLQALLLWAKKSLEIHFDPAMIRRKTFASQVTVYFDVNLDSLHPILKKISDFVSESESKQVAQPLTFRTSGITISSNALASKFTPGTFTIERRVNIPDAENKYYSGAPLPTLDHLALLEQFEQSLRK